MVDLIANIECKCSYDLNPNLTSFLKVKSGMITKKICLEKGYWTFESIKKNKDKRVLKSIHISTFTLQNSKEDSKYMANCVHNFGV